MELWSASGEAVLAALDQWDAAWEKLVSLPVDGLTAVQVLAVVERLEIARRRQPALEHALVVQLQSQSTAKQMGATSWPAVLSTRLGISASDARRRITHAAELGPRRAISGQRLEPRWAATAAAQARGCIGAEHVAVIGDFLAHLPADVDAGTRAVAESQLAGLAGGSTPEQTRGLARELLAYLDPDGTLDDEREHTRKRGITIEAQGLDGMSRIRGWLDPALRAAMDAILTKLAAPGHANPDDETPGIGGVPCQEQISADTRTGAQRNHDALQAVCTAMLASGTLGSDHGLPVTIVATTTLAELSSATGAARTAAGTRLPIATLIGRAATVHPYLLLIGENPRKIRLYYGRTRRTASPGQRLALYALERGCTKPGCPTPANRTQIHHAERDWQHGGNTDINELTLACGPDNRLVNTTPTGWTTRKRPTTNHTEWIPPPHLDHRQPRTNHYHHPEHLLQPDNHGQPGRGSSG